MVRRTVPVREPVRTGIFTGLHVDLGPRPTSSKGRQARKCAVIQHLLHVVFCMRYVYFLIVLGVVLEHLLCVVLLHALCVFLSLCYVQFFSICFV